MRFLLFGMLCIFLASCANSKDEKKVISKHSNAFNGSVQSAMDSYHALTEDFVNWDSGKAVQEAKRLQTRLDSIRLDEFKNEIRGTAEGSIDLAKKDLEAMQVNNGMTDKRHGLNSLTQNLYDFLRAVQYDEKKIYLDECPMAFTNRGHGLWLSEVDSIRNPYLGLHHPTYGKAMIDCGDKKSTIDYTTTK